MKKCPLAILSPKTKYGYNGECFNKDCALWDKFANGCLIRTYLVTQIEKSEIIVKPQDNAQGVKL